MELLQLRYFLTVARLEHITRAAEELCMTQPSLSKSISRLEKEVGSPLFDRSGRQIKLNESGRIFLKHVERIFFELEEAQIEIERHVHSSKVKIFLGSTIELPSTISIRYFQAFPDIILHSHVVEFDELTTLLDGNKIDVAIAEIPDYAQSEDWDTLLDDELYILVPARHKLADRASLSLYDIMGEAIFASPPFYPDRIRMEQLFAGYGMTARIFHEHSDPLQLLLSLERFGGISFFSKNFLHQTYVHSGKDCNLLENFRLIRIGKHGCSWDIAIKAAQKHVQSEHVCEFISFIKSQFLDIKKDRDAFIRLMLNV